MDAVFRPASENRVIKIRPPIERIERLEDLQKDVLREVLGFVVPADELVRDVEHLAPVLTDDQIPGALVTLQAPLNDRLDGVRGGGRIGRHEARTARSYQVI